MSNLRKYKFSDLYDISSGISSKPEQAGHGFPFLSFSAVFNNHFLPTLLPDLMDTSEKERKTYSIKKGDIFLTRTSETLDELALSSVAIADIQNATYSGFLKRLRPKQSDVTYAKFMAFYLRSKLFRKTMKNNAIMTLRASFNEQIFSYLDLLLPEFDAQKNIGDLLFLINEKIELNNKINAELEAIAKLIYDYWFVQFDFPDANGKPYKSSGGKMVYNEGLKREIPEGWEVKKLSDIATCIMGQSPKGETYNTKGVGTPLLNGPADYKNGALFGRTYTTSPTRLCEKDDLVLCIRATIGNLVYSEKQFCLGRGVAAVRPNDKKNSELIYYQVLQEIERFKRQATGSIIKGISKDDLSESSCIFPCPNLLERFHAHIRPIFEKQRLGKQESIRLTELRDWLLPMLMNGQVTVS